MIGIIVALEKEAEGVISLIENKKESIICGKRCVIGELSGKQVALIISGIGKVNSALSTQAVIDYLDADAIVNFGSVGGLKESVKPLEYYSVSRCCQYDFDLSKLDNCSVGYIQDYDRVYFDCEKTPLLPEATLASSDRFTCEKSDIDVIKSLNCDIFDMEGGAIAQVCLANNKKLYIIKGVTDLFGSGLQNEQFLKNLATVCAGFGKIVSKIIKEI